VEDLSFDVHAGEIVGLAGLQGSGNSSVLHGLFGDYGKIPQAKIALNDSDYVIHSPQHAIQNGLALLTNDRKENGLVLGMNVLQNTTLAALKKFSPGGWLRPSDEIAAAQKSAKTLNLKAGGLDVEVNTLSGGNQQKVVLAKWLETNPQVLLLDEPTRGVDVGAKHEIYKLMNELTEQGLAIVLITSEMPELLAMADRILVLHRGKLTATLNRKQATQDKILRAAMGETVIPEE
jgi:ABC-type sugar transport system ATPase subunit